MGRAVVSRRANLTNHLTEFSAPFVSAFARFQQLLQRRGPRRKVTLNTLLLTLTLLTLCVLPSCAPPFSASCKPN